MNYLLYFIFNQLIVFTTTKMSSSSTEMSSSSTEMSSSSTEMPPDRVFARFKSVITSYWSDRPCPFVFFKGNTLTDCSICGDPNILLPLFGRKNVRLYTERGPTVTLEQATILKKISKVYGNAF